MKKYLNFSQISLFVGIFLSSCLGSKFLEADQQLLTSQDTEGLDGFLEEDAELQFQQKKNSRFLILPFAHLAYIYQIGENGILFIPGYNKEKAIAKRDIIQKKFDEKIANTTKVKKKKKLREKKIRKIDRKKRKIKEGNQIMRWGEKLTIYDHNQTVITAQSIKQLLNSKGYFKASVEIDTSTYDSLSNVRKFGRNLRNGFSSITGDRDKYVDVKYYIEKGSRFYIDSIQYMFEDTTLQSIVFDKIEDAPLKKAFYSQENLTEERDFIYETAVNNGYFEFSKQYISFQLDTVQLGKDTIIVREIVRNPPNRDNHKVFYLDSIVFSSNADDLGGVRTTEEFKGITFNFGKDRYSKKILGWRIPLKQDDRYNRALTIETQRQLSFLDNFKFVNINYDTTGNKFIANIYTSPIEKYQTSSEFGLSTSQGANANVGNPGPFFNINLKNRNTFKALEIINIDAYAKLEDIRNAGENKSDADYTSIQYGGSIGVDFPQFLFPLGRFYKKKIGRFNPRTKLSLGLSYENRDLDYIRRTSNVSFSYNWQVKEKTRYTLTPTNFSFINSDNTDSFEEFLSELEEEGNSYANSFRSAFVNTTSFQLNRNIGGYAFWEDGGFIGTSIEHGGHFNPIFRSYFGENIEFYRFVKAGLDLRKIEKVSRRLNLAYKLNVGISYPYGTNNSLPYEKLLFAGGSSSIRAWSPRRLGPGSYSGDTLILRGDYRVVDLTLERSGELLIESSVELRRDLFGFIDGAIFLDAGNVWLLRGTIKPDNEGDDGRFRWNKFMDEMALGTGVGLRFDLSFLVFRVDLGLKLFDPAQEIGNRFVGDEIIRNFNENSEINIGIGYPF